MPIYEYECTSCCNVIEVFQRMTEDPLTVCPDCSGPVKKLVSRSSFQLKGGGWYSDGYCSKTGAGSGSGVTNEAAASGSEKTANADKTAKADKTEKAASGASDGTASKTGAENCSATA